MSAPVKLYWEDTPGGSMGGHSLLMIDEDVYVGHFYEDASDGVDVDAIFHLIAAAPDMLEALKAAMPYVARYESAHASNEALDILGMIDAAIAKATGQ